MVRTVCSHDVDQAVAEMVRVLSHTIPWTGRSSRVAGLELLEDGRSCCARPVGLRWTGRGLPDHDLPAFDLTIATDASPCVVLQVVIACGRLLSSAVTTASPQAHAWHWGACDPQASPRWESPKPSANACDITQGLGVPWLPPHRCARECCAVYSLMHRAVTPSRSSSGLPTSGTRRHPRVTSWVWRAAAS